MTVWLKSSSKNFGGLGQQKAYAFFMFASFSVTVSITWFLIVILNTVDISVSWMLDFEATEDLTILLIMKKADSFNLSDQPDRARVFFSAGTRVLLLNKIR